jgi:quercetin dioxygenase-like cupin family protein
VAEKKLPAYLKDHRLKGKALEFEVAAEMSDLVRRVKGNKSKRTAKTLVKEGPLRVLLVALDQGGELQEHSVDGPFSVQCLLGRAVVRVEGEAHELATGGLLVVDADIPHDVSAIEPSALLITMATTQGAPP